MKKNTAKYEINGILGKCGGLEVFLGFASSRILHKNSFAEILNEDNGEGYQRPYNQKHSLDFKRYITSGKTSTVPLVFNLRQELNEHWIITKSLNTATLCFYGDEACLARVDCQHRIGELGENDIPLAFMTFIGLDLRTEMAMFNTINSKAKGLSSSLTDYHESSLMDDIVYNAPYLFIARKLNEDPLSPWFKLVRYGGETTSGLKRRTSLRMLQKSIREFLSKTSRLDFGDVNDKYELIRTYWLAVRTTFPVEWEDHRHHLLTKGVGLYSMMWLLSDLVVELNGTWSEALFLKTLQALKSKINWHSRGPFAEAGGRKGVSEVYEKMKRALNT